MTDLHEDLRREPAVVGTSPDIAIDPYSATEVERSSDSVVALGLGRSLNRLRWHLTQRHLLPSYLAVPEISIELSCHEHHEIKAESCFEAIRLRAGRIARESDSSPSIDATIREAKKCSACGISEDFAERYDHLAKLVKDRFERIEDSDRRRISDELAGKIDGVVSILTSHINSKLSTTLRRWLELGIQTDQGVCRTDLARFLYTTDDDHVLVDPRCRYMQGYPPSSKGDSLYTPAGVDLSPPDALFFYHRAPGSVLPESTWKSALRSALDALQDNQVTAQVKERFPQLSGEETWNNKEQQNADIEGLFRILQSIGLPTLTVGEDGGSVKFDGNTIEDLSEAENILLREVGRRNGESITFKEIQQLYPTLFGNKNKRPHSLINRINNRLGRRVIESTTGRGLRLINCQWAPE